MSKHRLNQSIVDSVFVVSASFVLLGIVGGLVYIFTQDSKHETQNFNPIKSTVTVVSHTENLQVSFKTQSGQMIVAKDNTQSTETYRSNRKSLLLRLQQSKDLACLTYLEPIKGSEAQNELPRVKIFETGECK
ncbi:MAG: hypothetical protein ACRCXZ_10000 [Patescibacteria group bacterium]